MSDDGGPAFGHGDPTHGGNPGMSLRDWLAGQALISIGTWTPTVGGFIFLPSEAEGQKARAEWAYAQADAMLEARKKP